MQQQAIVISGTGLFTPAHAISNEALVASFNAYVEQHNAIHGDAIARGELAPLQTSSVDFIAKASGIKSRYVLEPQGILDPTRMCPRIPERPDDALSVQAEISVAAARQALAAAGKRASDIDAVIVACANFQRPYPAIAIEVQEALGIDGYAYDMNVACSSATFGIQAAYSAVMSGQAKSVLVINPEITSGHLNFRDRDSHFIFGDACTALVIEAADVCRAPEVFEISSIKLWTKFSNQIRNNFGFLNRADESGAGKDDKLFRQQGRSVFRQLVPCVVKLVAEHLQQQGLAATDLRRLWLHQANIHMNDFVVEKLLGTAEPGQVPVILDEYANTASAGSIIAFHNYRDGLENGDRGVICSFGAGYSIGSIIVQKVVR
jgi:beta-ketodecanoyl-[acyl-carrier-protein] synthase